MGRKIRRLLRTDLRGLIESPPGVLVVVAVVGTIEAVRLVRRGLARPLGRSRTPLRPPARPEPTPPAAEPQRTLNGRSLLDDMDEALREMRDRAA